MTFWWLSFCDPDRPRGQQFLGVCLVPSKSATTEGFKHALEGTHLFGCNPGGEVEGTALPVAFTARVRPEWVGRLMTREEAHAIDDELNNGVN